MGDVLAALGLIGFFAVVIGVLVWRGSRIRRHGRGVESAVMGPFQEVWHPAGHRARLETETVEERMAPMPSPDDQRRPGGARPPSSSPREVG